MATPANKIKFGEWLPDSPPLDNPGLTEARNVIWSGGNYVPYKPSFSIGQTFHAGTVLGAVLSAGLTNSPPFMFLAVLDGSGNVFLEGSLTGGLIVPVDLTGPALTHNPQTCSWAQYGTNVIYTDGANNPQFNPLSLSTAFAKLTGAFGDAPVAKQVGIVGQFVVLGNMSSVLGGAQNLQWSGINQPLNWPVPGSADAIAQQAGAQYLETSLGTILGISEGDQWGLVLLDGGLERMTYNGGNTVFQFDTIYRGPSAISNTSWVKVGNIVFSATPAGFIASDGTSVSPIGNDKVNNWFLANADFGVQESFSCGVDYRTKQVYWSFPLLGNGGVPNHWLAFNYLENKFTHGDDAIGRYVTANEAWTTQLGLQAFTVVSSGNPQAVNFTATPTAATMATAETELNPGGRAMLSGFRPQVDGTSNMSVRIGSRRSQADAVTYTGSITPNAQTGFADCLVDNNYHRAETTIAGAFSQAIGGEFTAAPSGSY